MSQRSPFCSKHCGRQARRGQRTCARCHAADMQKRRREQNRYFRDLETRLRVLEAAMRTPIGKPR